MQEYTFKYNVPMYFRVHANDDKEAVINARKVLNESSEGIGDYIAIDLTAGGVMGRVYIEPAEVSVNNITRREQIQEVETGVPF